MCVCLVGCLVGRCVGRLVGRVGLVIDGQVQLMLVMLTLSPRQAPCVFVFLRSASHLFQSDPRLRLLLCPLLRNGLRFGLSHARGRALPGEKKTKRRCRHALRQIETAKCLRCCPQNLKQSVLPPSLFKQSCLKRPVAMGKKVHPCWIG